ncbi:DUF1236 domain-containing protein [Bosea thiooxidans]|nr:DUF1236 domain-containing protein [Bosea sp. (in: a-proteobacteria)]
MIKRILFVAAIAALPVTAFAQSGPTSGPIIRDPTGGSTRDPALADPMMGGPALTRDPAGGTMISDEPGFRNYVMTQRVRSYHYRQPVEVGTVLPARGVMYHAVPSEYGAPGYRYTVVNDEAVIVEPRTRRVVEIIQ